MQKFITEHSGSLYTATGTSVFPASGGTIHGSPHPFFIENTFDVIAPVGKRLVFVASCNDGARQISSIPRIVSAAVSIVTPDTECTGFFYRIELPVGTDPVPLTYAALTAGINASVHPMSGNNGLHTLSARDFAILDLAPANPVTHGVYYGVYFVFNSASPTGITGHVSCREVVVDGPVFQPLK